MYPASYNFWAMNKMKEKKKNYYVKNEIKMPSLIIYLLKNKEKLLKHTGKS